MRKTAILALFLALSAFADFALMHSGWKNGRKEFAREFDKVVAPLHVKLDKYENTKIAELTKNLKKYEMVLLSSVANYENTIDLAPHAAAWKDYLEQGGILFVADATYDTTLEKFLNRISPELAMRQGLCSAHLKNTPESHRVDIHDHSILLFPMNIRPLLEKMSHWGHLVPVKPEGWEVIATCADKRALVALHRLGKGMVFVTAHGSLQRPGNAEYARAVIVNLRAQRNLAAQGIAVTSVKMPVGGYETAMALDLAAPGKADALAFSLTYRTKSGKKTVAATKTVDGDTVKLTAPVVYDCRGQIDFTGTLSSNGKAISEFSWYNTLPEILNFKMRRKHFYPGEDDLAVVFQAYPNDAKAGRLSVAASIDGKAQPAVALDDHQEGTGHFSLKGLPQGRHAVSFELLQSGRSQAKIDTEFFVHKAPAMRFREDGTLLKNGKPFFPFGMYSVSWSISNEQRKAMVKDIAQYGYNAVHVGIRHGELAADPATYRDFLDECAKYGVYVITEFGIEEALDIIRAYKDHPAVMGWNPGDEPAPKGITPEEMFRRYDSFKQLDPDHIAYTVICVPAQYKNYAAGTDVLAPDPYPVPRRPVDMVYTNFKSAYEEARKYDTALWAVPQCFGYKGENSSWPRPPTADEYRSMLYLSLLAGVKGFVNYTYYDAGFSLPKSEELWNACKTIPAEMKPLIPFVLDGRRAVCQETEKGIYAGTWTLAGRTAIVVVNTSTDQAKPFSVKGAFAKARLHYGAVDGFKADAAGVSGQLRPMGQAVLFVD